MERIERRRQEQKMKLETARTRPRRIGFNSAQSV
jgi:hypothetical protein